LPGEARKGEGFARRVIERIGRADPRLIEAALQQLLSQKQLLEVIFENLQEGLVVTDPKLRVLACNARARRWLGIAAHRRVVGESLLALIGVPEIFEFLTRTDFSQRRTVEEDFRLPRFAGFCLQLTSYPVGEGDGGLSSVVFVLRDVSAARQAEMQQRQAERIASLATLTAGIAHEMKNPLNSLQIHAQLANRMIDSVRESAQTVDLERLEASLHAILEETRRMARIVDDFLGAVRPTDPQKGEVRLKRLLEEVADSFERECEEKQIRLRVTCDPDLPPILLDGHQIGRALVNILRNSIEAIEERREEQKAGEEEIAGGRASDDSIVVACRIDGDDALIEVADTGSGIEPENLSKVFEPHFTTKFSGSGLGLMNVYRIAREHGGRAEIESEQGRGTCVRVRLPLTQRPVRLLTEEPPAAMGDSGSEVGESLENNTAD
jgi:PAS domain S-box-containing protein